MTHLVCDQAILQSSAVLQKVLHTQQLHHYLLLLLSAHYTCWPVSFLFPVLLYLQTVSLVLLASISTAALPNVLLCAIAGRTSEAFAEKSKQKIKRGAAKTKKASAPGDMDVGPAQAAGSSRLEAVPTVAPHEMVCHARQSVPHCQPRIRCLCHTGRLAVALLNSSEAFWTRRPFTLQLHLVFMRFG